ncbi:hypothetical protein Tco_0484753 [Tanacetum coccineum]
MLAPKCPTFNGNRTTFANPRYLKKAQNVDNHACMRSHMTNLILQTDRTDREETSTLEEESFAELEKHSISLEIALQECQEQLKNDTICKEKASNVFQKEREQYLEIQDLKAQFDIEKGFLSPKGRGNGVKEKSSLSSDVASKNKDCVNNSVVPSVIVDYGNIQKDLNDDRVAMEVQSPLVDQTNTVKTGRGSYPPLPTLGTNPAENTSTCDCISLSMINILWDIITNGNQYTTDPASPSVSAPKTSLAANAKIENILMESNKSNEFGGKRSIERRCKRILSIEDANLKFLRSLPSVWHVVATMIRGQPGLDELDFDDLYNNLKVYEHELKGVSNSPNIAFLSTEVKGSTLKQNESINMDIMGGKRGYDNGQRIRKFMRKTGRPIDLKPKNGITFDKSNDIAIEGTDKLKHDDWRWSFDAEHVHLDKMDLGIDELAIRNKVVNQEKQNQVKPEIDRNKVIIEDWVDSDDEAIQKEDLKGLCYLIDQWMLWMYVQEDKDKLSDFKGFKGGYVAFDNDYKRLEGIQEKKPSRLHA